jgi:PhoH-like ATPase
MNFAEHDVVIPITVLEELDQFKKGNDTKNF